MGLFDKFKKKKNEDYIDYTQEAQNKRFDEQAYGKKEEPVQSAEEILREKASETAQAKAEFEQTLNEAKQAQTQTATEEKQEEPKPKSEPIFSKEQEKQAKEAEKREKIKAKLEQQKQKAEIEAIKAKSEALAGSRQGAATKRFIGIVKGVSTMGGKVRIRPDAKKYYVPQMKPDTYVPTGMRSLTKPVMGQTLHTTSLRKAGTPNFVALRQSTTPGSRMGTQPRPGFQSSMPSRPSMNLTQSPIAKAAFGSVSNKSMLTGGSNQTQAMARLRELMMPRGLNRNEKIAFQGISEAGSGSRGQVVSELTARGMSQTEANMAVDGLVRKGAVRKMQTPSGEQVLEVTR